MGLRKFTSSELVLNHHEAWQTLVFFFGGNASTLPGWLTDNDRSFAQALLVEAIDKSYAMSWMEAIFRSTANPNASMKSVILKLGKKAVQDWFNSADREDLRNPKIYVAVRDQLTRNWRSEWRIRIETGEFVGY